MAASIWLVVAIIFYVKSCDGAAHKASDIATICHRSDPNLDDCIINSALELRPKLGTGIKALKIPPFEPFVIPKIQLRQGNEPVVLDASFTDVHVFRLSKYEIKKFHFDITSKTFYIEAYHPLIEISSNYEIKGKILSLPITGNGTSSCSYSDVFSILNITFKSETKNDKEFWALDKSDYDLDIKRANFHLNNLFNGNKKLGNTMNAFISENWQLVFQELKPILRDSINTIITDIATKVFKAFPIEELFPH